MSRLYYGRDEAYSMSDPVDLVAERNRNDGNVITLDDEHIIFSKKCPNDPVTYDLNTAICKHDGSVWIRIGAFT